MARLKVAQRQLKNRPDVGEALGSATITELRNKRPDLSAAKAAGFFCPTVRFTPT